MAATGATPGVMRRAVGPALVAVIIDLAAVLVFAVVGRASHAEALSVDGIVSVAWPFWAGAAVGALLAWALGAVRPALGPARVAGGVPVWIATVIVGLALRHLAGAGTAVAFMIVATITLAVLLLGWRAVRAGARLLLLRRVSA